MKKLIFLFQVFLAAFFVIGLINTDAVAGRDHRESRFSRLDRPSLEQSAQKNPAPSAGGEAGRPVTVAVVPSYHHIRHDDLTTVMDGTPLKSGSGTSRLGSIILTAAKPINETVSLSWIYQYTFGHYRGGLLVPDLPAFDGRSDLSLSSSMTGVIADFFLGRAGHLNVNFLVAWDSFSGQETMTTPFGRETRSVGRRDTRLGSVTAWYEIPFDLGQGLTLSPYAGWRTIRACLRGLAVWTEPPGTTSASNAWSHIYSGGLTLSYDRGPLNWKLWSGWNQRTKKGNIPGFASRAYSPGVANLGWMNNWDQGVWTYGFSVSRAVTDGVVLDFSYNGHKGSHTLAQAGNLAVVWIFK
ncbi:MAG: hypothetical protein LBP22_05795 [Deltaproteobacteria bacterium]|nr:hypothetical protein [Deltaproteobacteria bacterium]